MAIHMSVVCYCYINESSNGSDIPDLSKKGVPIYYKQIEHRQKIVLSWHFRKSDMSEPLITNVLVTTFFPRFKKSRRKISEVSLIIKRNNIEILVLASYTRFIFFVKGLNLEKMKIYIKKKTCVQQKHISPNCKVIFFKQLSVISSRAKRNIHKFPLISTLWSFSIIIVLRTINNNP